MNGKVSVISQNGDLVSHLLRFFESLRLRGFSIGPREAIDALRAVETVDFTDRNDFRLALRLVLCSSREEQDIFDEIYKDFIRYGAEQRGDRRIQSLPESRGDTGGKMVRDAEAPQISTKRSPVNRKRKGENGGLPGRRDKERPTETGKDAGKPGASSSFRGEDHSRRTFWPIAKYSPRDAKNASVVRIPEDGLEEMMMAAGTLIRRMELRQSRRWRPMKRGSRFDFRRTMRKSTSGGGHAMVPAWSGHPLRKARFVLLCDGSRSMTRFAERFLQFAHALVCRAKHTEVFLFSTRLCRVTDRFRQRGKNRLPTLTGLGMGWGGGTRIGESLERFVREYGPRMLSKDTLVIIASDGLDTGDIDKLKGAMGQLQRRAAGVVWINPLSVTPGYEPVARGMKAALSFIDTFSGARDPASYRELAKNIHFRR